MAAPHPPDPAKPNYLRVKIGRRLQRLGAAAIKNSVYAMPKSESAREHMEWVLRELVEGGGDGSICEARFVEGLLDEGVEGLFHAARDADYEALAEELRGLTKGLPRRRRLDEKRRAEVELELARLKRRLAEIAAIDFFGAPGRETVEGSSRASRSASRRARQLLPRRRHPLFSAPTIAPARG